MRNNHGLLVLLALYAIGCKDEGGAGIEPVSSHDGGGTDAAAPSDGGESDGGEAVTHDAYFAVLSDNYMGAVAISLLGKDGEVVENAWLDSSVKNPDLRTPLANDVVLPTLSPSRRYLTTIERGLAVVSRFDLEEGTVVGQFQTDASTEGDMAAFHSNPQDAFYLDDTHGWVSRWAKNLDPAAAKAEGGDDLVGFDPSAMKRTTARIDMSPFDATVMETPYDAKGNPLPEVESTAWARPSRLVPAGDHLVVALVRMTDGYTPAPGTTVVVDPATGEITGNVDLDVLKNCGDAYPVVGADNRVLVGCVGDFNTGLGPETGIAMIEVDAAGVPAVVEEWRAADHDGAAASGEYLASLGGTRVFAVASGTLDMNGGTMEPDRAYVVDLAAGTQELLFESDGAFSIGIPAFDAKTGVLLVPDAGLYDKPSYGVRRFRVNGADVTDDGFVEVAPKTTLAARQAQRL